MRLLGALAVLCAVLVPTLLEAAHASTLPQIMFGMGDEISAAESSPLYSAAPMGMVTSWMNNQGDAEGWMLGLGPQVQQLYAEGKANELVVDLNDTSTNQTGYALSGDCQGCFGAGGSQGNGFLYDIDQLTRVFEGSDPATDHLYIVLFTEWDTYEPGNTAYENDLMSAYENAVSLIHGVDPHAMVALGLGGYNWSSSPTATTDLAIPDAAIQGSDFVAVQAMQECTNETLLENEVRASIAQLSSFHKPIMVSYMNLWGNGDSSPYPCETGAMSAFEADIFNHATLSTLTSEGLFAWGFMDAPDVTTVGSTAFTTAVADVKEYGSGPDGSSPGGSSSVAGASGSTAAHGYALVGGDGGVFAFGGSPFLGSTGALRLAEPIVGMADAPDGAGYWLVAQDGGIFSFGAAPFEGSVPEVASVDDVVGMAASTRGGYWVATSDGQTYAFGAAPSEPSLASLGVQVDDIVGIAATADGGGYYLVGSDGGVYALGDAAFEGSMGARPLNRPVVGMAVDPATGGYWLVAQDGGIFAFGAPFFGSTGALHLVRPIVGMAVTPNGGGYWFVAADGGVFAEGDAPFAGSLPGLGDTPASPIVGMVA